MQERPPPWYEIALQELAASVAERGGGDHHPRILEYLATCGDLEEGEAERDSTPWCSAFVNWCLARAGIEGTNSGWARSWADWGEPIDPPRPGAIAVWARGRDFAEEPLVTGHVSFFVEDRGDSLLVLGGNQSDSVSLKTYPKRGYLAATVDSAAPVRELYELLGYRWPAGVGADPA
ncbi:MAG TPA: TIGR02594 family protein [Allosphingosinicella sp.]|nr:TIGR02594 family protein [Allosphingosinicella sp.]